MAESEEFKKGVLEPMSKEHPQYGRIRKVFLAYIHNPNVYEKYVPPYDIQQLLSDLSLQERVREEMHHHAEQQQSNKQAHEDLVKEFAECLHSKGVAVAYDRYFEQERIECTYLYYEQQIRDSDFVLLVITPSLEYYLKNDPPDEEPMAPLFASKALVNLMSVQRPPRTHFIPIFLDCDRDTSLVPVCLAGASMFTIHRPFDVEKGDLYNLYNILTNQQVNKPPEPGPVIVLPQRPRFGAGLVTKLPNMSPENRRLYTNLSNCHSPLLATSFLDISQGLSPQWKLIGEKLGLTARTLAEVEVATGTDRKEACYQMLCKWREYNQDSAVVSRLANAVCQTQYYDLLKPLGVLLRS